MREGGNERDFFFFPFPTPTSQHPCTLSLAFDISKRDLPGKEKGNAIGCLRSFLPPDLQAFSDIPHFLLPLLFESTVCEEKEVKSLGRIMRLQMCVAGITGIN